MRYLHEPPAGEDTLGAATLGALSIICDLLLPCLTARTRLRIAAAGANSAPSITILPSRTECGGYRVLPLSNANPVRCYRVDCMRG